MDVLYIVLSVIFVIMALAITVLVMMQEGKSAGFTGSISGIADSYFGKNKGRTIEGALEKATTILVVLFFIMALFLNCKIFK